VPGGIAPSVPGAPGGGPAGSDSVVMSAPGTAAPKGWVAGPDAPGLESSGEEAGGAGAGVLELEGRALISGRR
jgi:hypothetical protein